MLARSRRYGWTVTSTAATGSPSRSQQPTATLNLPGRFPPLEHCRLRHLYTSAPLPPSNSTRTINSTLAGWSRPIPAAQPAQPVQLFRYSCFLPMCTVWCWLVPALPASALAPGLKCCRRIPAQTGLIYPLVPWSPMPVARVSICSQRLSVSFLFSSTVCSVQYLASLYC